MPASRVSPINRGLDKDAHVLQNILEHIGPLQGDGLVAVLLIALSGKDGALGAHLGLSLQQLLPEMLHPGRQIAEMLCILHGL